MRMLTTNAMLTSEFSKLLNQHKYLSGVVAWASVDFPCYDQLAGAAKKIKKLVVGLHFCQTSPDFIETFTHHKGVRFIKQASGVFHPKVYLFESSEDEWACIVGSANFTSAAFRKNQEASVLLTARDIGSTSARHTIETLITNSWKDAAPFKQTELGNYRFLARRARRALSPFSWKKTAAEEGDRVLRGTILEMTWREFLKKVKEENREDAPEGRIALLQEIRRLFEERGSLARMGSDERRLVAGFGGYAGLGWGWFGSMRGAGRFKELVNKANAVLSEALDTIPLQGVVSRGHYDAFVDRYVRAFPKGKGHGLGTATRLLTVKRPDYFVTMNDANNVALFEEFGVTVGHHEYGRYWDEIVERILISEWWNSARPRDEESAAIWDGRAAFLDAIFYTG